MFVNWFGCRKANYPLLGNYNDQSHNKDTKIRVIAALIFWGLCVIAIPVLVFKFFPTFGWFSGIANFYLKLLFIFILLTFCLFGLDKFFAHINARRIPNNALYGCSIASAGIGSWLARKKFKHKVSDQDTNGKRYATNYKIIESFSLASHALLFIVIC